MSRRWCLGLALALALPGCANRAASEHARVALTERQRDSVLAQSSLPGASVVGRALGESDKAAHRAAGLDSLTH